MGTIGGEDLCSKYGSPLAVAEALLLGKLCSYDMKFFDEVVSPLVLEAARIRLSASGALNEAMLKLEELREIALFFAKTKQIQKLASDRLQCKICGCEAFKEEHLSHKNCVWKLARKIMKVNDKYIDEPSLK